MVVAGRPDALSIASALEQVRHVSWEDGRTLRGKHVVLLASAEVGTRNFEISRLVQNN